MKMTLGKERDEHVQVRCGDGDDIHDILGGERGARVVN